MRELSFNKFISNIKSYIDQAFKEKEQLKILRRSGRDFIIVDATDWENEREVIYILQNLPLMKQISDSDDTHSTSSGYIPQKDELNEIIGI